MIPKKLSVGDEIRVIAPSRNINILNSEQIKNAKMHLKSLGLSVSFSKNIRNVDQLQFDSSSIESRIEDIHAAFKDKNINGVLTTIGGFNVNQLLDYIDYRLIKKNPKILSGYSDITALSNAIYAKTGLITYSGPHFSTFGRKLLDKYTIDYFKKALMTNSPFDIAPSEYWNDDEWYINQSLKNEIKNTGYWVINKGEAKGTLIGGNMCTFVLLNGTQYMPTLKNSILLLEEDDGFGEMTAKYFDRDLQSLIHQPGFNGVKGILIGRFQKKSNVDYDKLYKIIKSKKELDGIPVIANVDFGHTEPMLTLPIGGIAEMYSNKEARIKIITH